MIDFPDSFFEGEYRDGFYVKPMMKRVWAAEMETYLDIAEVCRQHQIRFFADWGTLLGTVRHKGFVPWDDDMDIGMLRGDYMKFISIAAKALPEGYAMLNLHTDDDFDGLLSRVVNTKEINLSEGHLERFHGCPYAVGIDVFPIDYIPRDEKEEEVQKQLIKIVSTAENMLVQEGKDSEELQQLLEQIQQLCGVTFSEDKPLKRQLYGLAEQLCSLYSDEDADCVTSMPDLVNGRDYRPAKSCYAKHIMMPFENIEVPVPVGYDEVLKVKYGDYMTPVNCSGGHEYPFYASQEKILREYLQREGISGERFDL